MGRASVAGLVGFVQCGKASGAHAGTDLAGQKIRFIMSIITTRNNIVMIPPARMKSGTR